MEGILSTNSSGHFITSNQFYHRPLMTVASNMSTHAFHRFPLRPQPFPPFIGFGEPLSPLDLSVKNTIPITPPCTPSPPRKSNRVDQEKITLEDNNNEIILNKESVNDDCEMLEDLSLKTKENKRKRDEFRGEKKDSDEKSDEDIVKPPKIVKHINEHLEFGQRTPIHNDMDISDRYSPEIDIVNIDDKPKKPNQKSSAMKKNKAVRKLLFDEDKSSPVSGTIIRELADDETLVVRKGDIDPAFNVVEITEEAKATLASIENKLGSYICRLCRQLYEDAFTLAQHRCSRIVHIEYRCPECDKVFNCPANLASHRRWHKPRVPGDSKHRKMQQTASVMQDGEIISNDVPDDGTKYPCNICGKVFRRQAYLRKHMTSHTHSGGEAKDGEKVDGSKPTKETYEFEDDVKVIDDSLPNKLQSGGQELSAFHQVQADGKKSIHQYEMGEEIRDTNFNTFWNKIPPNFTNLGVNYFAYNDSAAERYHNHSNYYKNLHSYEQNRRRYVASITSESEESQTLDITGSEDERTAAADRDISESASSKMDLDMENN